MDHLGQWIRQTRMLVHRLQRQARRSRSVAAGGLEAARLAMARVESIISAIPQDLMANAAFRCKAFARALLNFEKRVVSLKNTNKRSDDDLQDIYERLHEIYADLDEPDGMEGISAKIISPTLAHQIREHETTGRWTSAQSCWELRLQLNSNDAESHIGLLKCLLNLGHYGNPIKAGPCFTVSSHSPLVTDSMRTHIVGVLHEHPEWERLLAPFEIEAALVVGDWAKVDAISCLSDLQGPQAAFGNVIKALRTGNTDAFSTALHAARSELGTPILAAGRNSYRRVYDAVVQLHVLHELETIANSTRTLAATQQTFPSTELNEFLAARLHSSSPSFRTRETILNMRRTAFRLRSAALHCCSPCQH
jgi:serine/threonine-protein kinase ATR